MESITIADDRADDRRLVQRVGWFGRQELVLLEDKLTCRFRRFGNRNEFAIPLRELDADALRIHRKPWGWYGGTAVLMLVTIGCVIGEMNAARRDSGMFGTLGFFTFCFALTCAFQSFKQTIDALIFRTTRGNLVIAASEPDAATCQAFVRLLQTAATDAQSIEKRIVRALLATLHSEGFLDKWQFEKARERFENSDGH